MILENKQVLYLCADCISSSSCVFSASFAEDARISDCFVLANSLKEAVSVIYSALSSRFPVKFIDSYLLDVKFVKRVDVVHYE